MSNKIIGIMAIDDSGGVGYKGGLPWPHNKSDMRLFRQLTTNNVVIMGRKTWETLEKPLPNRVNIVVSRSKTFSRYSEVDMHLPHITLDSVKDIMKFYRKDVYIIGGPDLFTQTIPFMEYIYITNIFGKYKSDTFFDVNATFLSEKLEGEYDKFELEKIFNHPDGTCSFTKYKRSFLN